MWGSLSALVCGLQPLSLNSSTISVSHLNMIDSSRRNHASLARSGQLNLFGVFDEISLN